VEQGTFHNLKNIIDQENLLKFVKFRLQNYKRIHDSGWITIGDLTAFVGKNESGKSSIFRGLSKLNPSDGEKYDEFYELPRKHYNEYKDQNLPASSGCFELTKEEKEEILAIDPSMINLFDVTIIRKYDDECVVIFTGVPENGVTEEVKRYILEKLPSFIYFDKYDILDSDVNIPQFINSVTADPNNRKLRVTKCLFEFVKLSLDDLQNLNPSDKEDDVTRQRKIKQLNALCVSAASLMTDKFSKWWDQRKHVFSYNVNSNLFNITVSDNLDNIPIELELRSAGFQYFFSFYLIFLVESTRNHNNSILLLDEPGLHYHGTFQLKLLKFFKKISQNNQLLYTTHSPFMVNSKTLDEIKSVYEDKDSGYTKIANNGEWPKDQDALFPIRVGWWYDVFNSYIQDKIHLIVEGSTDMQIINAIKKQLEKKSKPSLHSDILVVPGGGKKTRILVSLLYAQDVKMILFQDGDQAGKYRSNQIKKDYGISFVLTSDTESSIEDLFSEDMYLTAVKNAYSDYSLDFNESEKQIPMITKRFEKLFERKGLGKMDKYVVTKELIKIIPDNPESVQPFEEIFSKINNIASKISIATS